MNMEWHPWEGTSDPRAFQGFAPLKDHDLRHKPSVEVPANNYSEPVLSEAGLTALLVEPR